MKVSYIQSIPQRNRAEDNQGNDGPKVGDDGVKPGANTSSASAQHANR
jgi:hypothetical protein